MHACRPSEYSDGSHDGRAKWHSGAFFEKLEGSKWPGKGGEGGVRPMYHESLQRMGFSQLPPLPAFPPPVDAPKSTSAPVPARGISVFEVIIPEPTHARAGKLYIKYHSQKPPFIICNPDQDQNQSHRYGIQETQHSNENNAHIAG